LNTRLTILLAPFSASQSLSRAMDSPKEGDKPPASCNRDLWRGGVRVLQFP
jgi:hypothetical protein